jgi:hypothetical protein
VNRDLFWSAHPTKDNARGERASALLKHSINQHYNLSQARAERRFLNALGAMVYSEKIDQATALVLLRIAKGAE